MGNGEWGMGERSLGTLSRNRSAAHFHGFQWPFTIRAPEGMLQAHGSDPHMPTIFTHAAVPVLLGTAAGKRHISQRLLCAGVIAAILPDADTLGFKLGIAYADAFGHRGAMHSLLFACCMAALAALWHRRLRTTPMRALAFVGLSALTHPLLDMLTDGGLGIAIAWPWSEQRYFFPWRPIHVSPIGVRFFSARSEGVIISELLWVWLPASLLALAVWRWRASRNQHG
jgi:inner membrane protein